MGKKEIYASYGITYESGKLFNSVFGYVAPMLINGNAKLGRGVWTFSTLPGNGNYSVSVNGIQVETAGTCACNCSGCYAQTGFYRMSSTIKALALRTAIARNQIDWLERAIKAQIKADNIQLCRIHASGDFHNSEYVEMWKRICMDCPNCVFWTYTKNASAESAFNEIANCNVVKSLIPGVGMNYGHCDYILDTYAALKNAGKSVHLCKCGFDKNQHCVNCKGCSENEYVLFVEHSTNYKAESDPSYFRLAEIANS